jgi:hypothetical protein
MKNLRHSNQITYKIYYSNRKWNNRSQRLRLTDGGALLFRPPATAADLFTYAKVNYKSSIFNVPLKQLPRLAFSRLLQCPAPLLVNRC